MERHGFALLLCIVFGVQRVMGYFLWSASRNEFPTDIPANETEIELVLRHRDMLSIPQDAFEPFFQLIDFSFAYSPLYEWPNLIPVGGTLEKLEFLDCRLLGVNATVLSELRVLRILRINRNMIQSFPQLSAGTGPQHTLQTLYLQSNLLTALPDMSFYTALAYLNIQDNRLVAEAPVEVLVGIANVIMDGNNITRLPPDPRLYQKRDAFLISLRSTPVSVVPLTCPQPRATQEFRLYGSAVSMCTCENVWLAAMDADGRGEFFMDNATCAGASTTQELMETSCPSRNTALRVFHVRLIARGFFCTFPVVSFTPDVSKRDCAIRCAATQGCYNFGFLHTSATHGNCSVLAPTDTPLIDIPGADNPDWNHYNIRI